MVRHLLDVHSTRDFQLIGIQPYMLARSLPEYEDSYSALMEPLEKFVQEFPMDVKKKPPMALKCSRSEQASSKAPAQAPSISWDDLLFDPCPELALLRLSNMFSSLAIRPFQSVYYDCKVDPLSGLLCYFYPVNFFERESYACVGWTNLMRLFHLWESQKHGGYTSSGTTGVLVTFQEGAAN